MSTDDLLINCCKECNDYKEKMTDDEFMEHLDKCSKSKCPVLELFCRYCESEENILQLENKIEAYDLRMAEAIKILGGKQHE